MSGHPDRAPGRAAATVFRIASAVLVLVAVGCSGSGPLTGRWRGSIGDPCPGTALLQTGHGQAVFVRDDGAQALKGSVGPDGTVTARLQTQGADKKGFAQSFTGKIQGDTVSGTYGSPRCTAPVTLRTG